MGLREERDVQPPAYVQLRDGAGVGGTRTDERCTGSCAAQARRVPRGRRGVAVARAAVRLECGAWLTLGLTAAARIRPHCVSVPL